MEIFQRSVLKNTTCTLIVLNGFEVPLLRKQEVVFGFTFSKKGKGLNGFVHKKEMGKLALYIPLVNKVRCKKCGDIIESKHVNHMVRCTCKSISVDGGNEYQKLVGKIEDIDMSYSKYKEFDD